MVGWALTALIVVFILWFICVFNRLVTLKNEVKNAWHQIDVQLKRRHDLIPNLVSVVKGYMEFERNTFEAVTAARTKAVYAAGISEKAKAENALTEALGRLFAVMENYPTLKSNENAMRLQEELASTENRIAFSRQLYNDLVANYRTKLEVFPDNIVASLFSFKAAEYFSADKEDRGLPRADIGLRTK
jgi:LemA protein